MSGALVAQDLDRHLSREVCVLGTVDFAHAARTELFRDAVVGERCADHGDDPLER